MKRVMVFLLTFISILFFVACTTTSESLTFYFRELYVQGEAIETQPKLDESINIPLISNIQFDSIEFVSIEGENVNGIVGTIANPMLLQFSEYGRYIVSEVIVRFVKYQFSGSSHITAISFRFSTEGVESIVTFPFDVLFRYDSGVNPVSSFASLKRIQAVQQDVSVPYFFFVINPAYSFTARSFSTSNSGTLLNLQYGIAVSSNFNDINDTDLTNADPSNLGVQIIAGYNIYFDLHFEIEPGEYCQSFFPIILNVEFLNEESYSLLVLNTNAISPSITNVYSYIDAGFEA